MKRHITPMQDVLNYVKERIKMFDEEVSIKKRDNSFDAVIFELNELLDKIEILIKKEEQQIIEAYITGWINGNDENSEIESIIIKSKKYYEKITKC